MKNQTLKRLTRNAMLTAVALSIFIVEAQLPVLVPIPGVKLGLANIITVYSMFMFGPRDTFFIFICRVLLGSIFAGQMMSLFYSLCGGLSCYLLMFFLRKIVTINQIWVCSVLGAIAHNIGQIIAAIIITGTPAIVSYLPILLISGILSGIFTGFTAQFVVHKMKAISPLLKE